MKKLLLVLFLILASSGCSNQKVVDISSHLYQIKKNSSYLYLLATIEVGKEFDCYDNDTQQAYRESDMLVVENLSSHIDEMNYLYKEPMKTVCQPDSIKELMKNIGQYETNLIYFDEEKMANYNPIVISRTLKSAIYQEMGYFHNYGIETYFIKKGKEDQKAFAELESIADQEKYILKTAKEYGNDIILETARYDHNVKRQENLVDLYYHGTKSEINSHYYDRDSSEKLNDERNNKIMQKVDNYLQDDKVEFIMLDTKLVEGKQGLISLLKQNDCQVIEY